MKNHIHKKFRKGIHIQKQVFLFSNIIILVLVLALTWSAYNPNNNTITFPTNDYTPNFSTSTNPSESMNATDPSDDVTIPTEGTIEPTTQPSQPAEQDQPESEYPKYHKVIQGDTWYNISIEYFGSDKYADVLAYSNDRTMTDYIFIGEILKIESEDYLIQLANDIRNSDSEEDFYTFKAGPFGYEYGKRPNPAVDITVSKDCTGKNNTGKVDTSSFEYIGNHLITAYDPYCEHCCSGTGMMASGNYAISGYSVAASYPLGTTLYIEGYGFYVVEDRGVSGKHIDIAAPSHNDCYALTNYSVAVYIVPNNN